MKDFIYRLLLLSIVCGFYQTTYSQSIKAEAKDLLIKAQKANNNMADSEARNFAKEGMNLYHDGVSKDTLYYKLFDQWLYSTMYLGTSDTILEYVDRYVTGAMSYYGNDTENGIQSLKHKANYYFLKGEYDQAIKEFNTVIAAYEKVEEPNLKSIARVRSDKAMCYGRVFRLDDALLEYLEVLEINKKLSKNGESNEVAKCLSNIGVVHWLKGDMEKSLAYSIESYEMKLKVNGRFSGNNLQTIYNIVIGHIDVKEHEKGLYYVNEGITVGTKLQGEKSEYVFSMYGLKSVLLLDINKYNEAEKALIKAKEIMDGAEWVSTKSRIEYYTDLAVLKQKQLNFSEAVENFHKSLILNTNNTNKDGIDGVFDYWNYYMTVQHYGDCYKAWYKKEGGEEKLDSAIRYHTLLMDFLDDVREKNPSNYASTYSGEYHHNSWTYAEDLFLINDYEAALQTIEENKTYSTLNAVNNQEMFFADVKNDQLDSMASQKTLANSLEKQLLQIEDEQSKEYTETLSSLQKARVNYDEQLALIKKDNPELYALKFEPPKFSFDEIKDKLDPNQCIIEYSVSDNFLGIYVITAENIEATYIPSEGIETLVTSTYKSIIDKEDATQSLLKISDAIINPIEDFITPEISQLIIVPEWYLASFPFELLSLNDQQIIQNYDMSYSNSTLQFLQVKDKTSQGNGEIACFVPNYNTIDTTDFQDQDIPQFAELVRSGYYNLPGAKAETDAILNTISGKAFFGRSATKTSLLNDARDFSIIHFAMHSEMNKEKPLHSALLFSSDSEESYDKLKALELYNESFNSDLVVLSACSSGYDRFNKSEGVLGFAKAFAYAGVPSLVYSIWKIPDNSSSYLMTHFYNHLAEGKAKDQALRLAKLDYINDDAIPSSQKKPYYWAGFIASGNMNPIEIGANNNWMYWLIGGLILISLFVFLKRNSSNKVK